MSDTIRKNKKINQDKDFYKVIEGFASTDHLPFNELAEMFSQETTRIINKLIDPDAEIEFEIDHEKKEIKIYNKNAEVIEDLSENETLTTADEIYQIELTKAKKILRNKSLKVGDYVKIPINLIALKETSEDKDVLKVILQALTQGRRQLKKKHIYEIYSRRIGDSVTALFNSKNKDGSWNVEFADKTSAYLPSMFISKLRNIKVGEWHQVVIEKVIEDTKLSQVQVSLDSTNIIKKELIDSIPEINEGLIEIVNIVRKPGIKTKVAIRKTELAPSELDAYGSVIGIDGIRVKTISKKNFGEKIDIVEWNDDLKIFIANALTPGKVSDVVPSKEKNNAYYAIVSNEDGNISKAIGQKGDNAVLASQLTKALIDVISIEKAQELKLEFNTNAFETKEMSKLNVKVSRENKVKTKPRTSKSQSIFDNLNFTMDSFDSDIEAFELEEKERFENQRFDDFDFEELYKHHLDNKKEETQVDEVQEAEVKKENKAKNNENSLKEYKEAKKLVKDFKVDNDLINFGNNLDLDLSEFDDEEWD